MKDFIYNKLIKYFVLFSPIVDIITSYMYYQNYKITIGLIIKGIVLVLAFIYLVIYDKENRKKNILYFVLIFFWLLINIYNNIDIIKISALSYISYVFKFLFFLIMLLFFIRWYKEYSIKLSDLRIPLLIICVTSIISILTNTAYVSYQYNIHKIGLSMWYSSANELGNILCLLLPVCIYNAFHNKDGIKLDLYLIPVSGVILLFLGTKVGLFGYFLILFGYLIIRLIFIKKIRLDLKFIIIPMMIILPLFFFKYLPGIYNINVSMVRDTENTILNRRDEFLETVLEKRENNNFLSKAFGKSYYGKLKRTEEIMLVEQDFIDILIMFGYTGIILVLLPIINLYYYFLKTNINLYNKNKKVSKKYIAVIIAVSLLLGEAFISGHAVLTPSVSMYLIVLMAIIMNIKFNHKEKKVFILLSDNVNNVIKNKDKYDIEIVESNGVYKNRLLIYLCIKNMKYDYVIINNDDTKYVKLYLKYCEGVHINYNDFRW